MKRLAEAMDPYQEPPADGTSGKRSVQPPAEAPPRVHLMHRTCYAYDRAV
jgi:hypothetical protein